MNYDKNRSRYLARQSPPDILVEYRRRRISVYELDLFDFVLNYRSNSLALLAGYYGVGKTTFLKNIAFHLQDTLASLRNHLFIYLDFRQVDSSALSNQVLFDLIAHAISQLRYKLSPDDQFVELSSFIHLFHTNPENIQVTTIHHLARQLRDNFHLQPVFLLDNVDQLNPLAMTNITEFGRSLYFATGSTVIVSLRPPSDTLRVGFANAKAAFFPFVLELPAPNLLDVIQRRLLRALEIASRSIARKNTAIVDSHGFKIRFTDLKSKTKNAVRNILTPSNQQFLLRSISNNSTRIAIQAFINFLKHRDLSLNMAFNFRNKEAYPYFQRHLLVTKRDHLITGIMQGDRTLYSDVADITKPSPIANLYYAFYPSMAAPSHILLYYVLTIYALTETFLESSAVCAALEALAVPPEAVLRAISYLTTKGLLVGSDTEGPDISPRHAKLSQTGSYYLNSLIVERQYILNVVYDTDVEVGIDAEVDPNKLDRLCQFRFRLDAVSQLLRKLADEDYCFVSRISGSNSKDAKIIRALSVFGALSSRLQALFADLSRPRKTIRHGDVEEFNRWLATRASEVNQATSYYLSAIRTMVGHFRTASAPRTDEQLKQYRLEGFGQLHLYHPASLDVAGRNRITVSFMPDFKVEATEIGGLWSASDPDLFRAVFFRLRRTRRNAPFKGEFSVNPENRTVPFPKESDIKFFDDDASHLCAMTLAA